MTRTRSKTCKRCKKPHSGDTRSCERCKQYSRDWNKKNPEKKRQARIVWYTRAGGARYYRSYFKKNRKEHLGTIRKYKYGLERGAYEKMVAQQGDLCAICDKKPRGKPLHVDHDHKTGNVRELLCFNCNAMLGHAKDSETNLHNGILYLRKHAQ